MIAFAILIFAIGLVLQRRQQSGQAFFEAGGETPWWINALLFISYFSRQLCGLPLRISSAWWLMPSRLPWLSAVCWRRIIYCRQMETHRGKTAAAEFIGRRFNTGTQQFPPPDTHIKPHYYRWYYIPLVNGERCHAAFIKYLHHNNQSLLFCILLLAGVPNPSALLQPFYSGTCGIQRSAWI